MKLGEALIIVYELANQNKLTGQEKGNNPVEADCQQKALDIVDDFIDEVEQGGLSYANLS